jgi:glucose-6-phosphate isomerase
MTEKKEEPSTLPYTQSFGDLSKKDNAFKQAHQESLIKAEDARKTLRKYGEKGDLQMLEAVFWQKDLADIAKSAKPYRRFHSVVIIGMGGASLSGKAMASLYQSWIMADSSFPFLYFLDNLDPEIFWELMSVLNPRTTGVIVISKSGETPETLLLLMRCLEYWQDFLTAQEIGGHFTAITRHNSTLSRVAHHFNFSQFEHPSRIGGRFSCFTIVGLLPAFIAGCDPKKIRLGGALVLKNFFAKASKAPPLLGAAWVHALMNAYTMNNHVMMSYGDAFQSFLAWNRQLIGESLGKEGKGINPICALGPADQHSQLQLYLDGPRDKMFTIFVEQQLPREKPRHELWDKFQEIGFLAYNSLESLVHAEERATSTVLRDRGCPTRNFQVTTFNEIALGALFAHFILETLILAELMEVNPLNQPAVESIKALSKRFLIKQQTNR